MDWYITPPPLPSSVSAVLSSNPTPLAQWRSALNSVKLLYIRRQYKQCTALCEELLEEMDARGQPHALYEVFLFFYAAISYETLGQAAHNFSSKKLPLLQKSKDAFLSASIALPLEHIVEKTTANYPWGSDAGSPILSDGVSLSNGSNTSVPTPTSGTFLWTTDCPYLLEKGDSEDSLACINEIGSPSSFKRAPIGMGIVDSKQTSVTFSSPRVRSTNVQDDDLTPKPLCIKKKANLAGSASESSPLPRIPKKGTGVGQRKTAIEPIQVPVNRACVPMRGSFTSYLQERTVRRYNNYLQTFHGQLRAHIVEVDYLIVLTTQLQNEHRIKQTRRFASFWSFSPAQVDEGQDPRQRQIKHRIEKLRDQGWMVKKEGRGFKGTQFYEDLCTKALAELEGK